MLEKNVMCLVVLVCYPNEKKRTTKNRSLCGTNNNSQNKRGNFSNPPIGNAKEEINKAPRQNWQARKIENKFEGEGIPFENTD